MSDKFVLYFNKMKQNPLLDRKQCVSTINGRSLGLGGRSHSHLAILDR